MFFNFETSFLTKNFNCVQRRLLGFLGYSLFDEDSYRFFADLGEARSHIIYYNETKPTCLVQ